MKMKFYTLSALCLTFLLASCGGGEEKETTVDAAKEKCFYSFNDQVFELNWTAYKTNAKVAVGGTFNEVTFTAGEAESASEAIESIEFVINTGSVESNNEDRNAKIAEHFFGTINAPEITGNVKSYDAENQKAVVVISMAGISMDVEGTMTMEENDFTFDAVIDVASWNGMAGITALNTVCKDLHTGEDGVSKLWSEVAINFHGSLNKNCE